MKYPGEKKAFNGEYCFTGAKLMIGGKPLLTAVIVESPEEHQELITKLIETKSGLLKKKA